MIQTCHIYFLSNSDLASNYHRLARKLHANLDVHVVLLDILVV